MIDRITVDVVLASYNGEKYICEQIDSILSQTHKNIELYISDDGSTDGTVSILLDYQKKDNRVHVINTKRVGGVISNFEVALSATKSNYIMLSDQDDFWLPNKIEIQLKKILIEEKKIKNNPVLGFTDLSLVDENLILISDSFYKAAGLDPKRNFHYTNLSWMGSVMGCTIIMNRLALEQALPFHHPVIMHDHWLAMKTLEKGNLFFIDEPLILYRQHRENVSGGLGFRRSIFKKIFDFQSYKTIIKRARIVSSMHNTDSVYKRFKFSRNIILGISKCETLKYPLLFLIAYLFFGKHRS